MFGIPLIHGNIQFSGRIRKIHDASELGCVKTIL